jgi:hypothetical protein
MVKRKKPLETMKNGLDTVSEKRPRGRGRRLRFEEILGRAEDYRMVLDQVWDRLWPLASTASDEVEILDAFQKGASPYESYFTPGLAALALKTLRERTFPKRRRSRINFLADSLAGVGVVSLRRSRDICAEERARTQAQHHILRYEYYVECSCGYKGPSLNHACRKCNAAIEFPLGSQTLSL